MLLGSLNSKYSSLGDDNSNILKSLHVLQMYQRRFYIRNHFWLGVYIKLSIFIKSFPQQIGFIPKTWNFSLGYLRIHQLCMKMTNACGIKKNCEAEVGFEPRTPMNKRLSLKNVLNVMYTQNDKVISYLVSL